MTDTPSLPAQIEAREPGWYWVRVFEGGPWHPYHWYHSRDGEAFWIGRAVDDEPMAEIGPRIPDPVTLQQHERDDTRIKQLDDECQRFMREVALLREGHERLEAEYARLSETAGEDYAVGVQGGMKLSADHIERLEVALRSAPVMSMYHGQRGFEVERFIIDYETWRKQCRAALDAAAPETPHG